MNFKNNPLEQVLKVKLSSEGRQIDIRNIKHVMKDGDMVTNGLERILICLNVFLAHVWSGCSLARRMAAWT
jgi:hypothetical protein